MMMMMMREKGRCFMSVLVVLLVLQFLKILHSDAAFVCPQAIIAFGDSLSDTGNQCAAHPLGEPQNPPFGMTYFHHPANRMSDGRLLIDFIAQAFNFPLLDPYLKDLKPDYEHGINFAYSGAEARSINFENEHLHLPVQLNQFQYFKSQVLSAAASPGIPTAQSFDTALYFLYAGINDFLHANRYAHLNFEQQKTVLAPQVVVSIGNAVEKLYSQGGRTFMLVNLPPRGCTPNSLANHTTNDPTDYDSNGCLIAHNSVMETYNSQLLVKVNALRQHLPGATIMYADCYQAYIDAVANPEKNGFGRDTAKTACLSSPHVCADPGSYISWDGLHYTEAFNRFMARSFLTGQLIDSPVNLSVACNLNFQNF